MHILPLFLFTTVVYIPIVYKSRLHSPPFIENNFIVMSYALLIFFLLLLISGLSSAEERHVSIVVDISYYTYIIYLYLGVYIILYARDVVVQNRVTFSRVIHWFRRCRIHIAI